MSERVRKRVRVPLNTASFGDPQDRLTNQQVKVWRASAVDFEVGYFFGQTLQTDFGDLQSVTMQIKELTSGTSAPDPQETAVASKTVTEFDDELTLEDWNAGGEQHAVFSFSAAEMNQTPGKYWMVFVAVYETGPSPQILGAGQFEIAEAGAAEGIAPPTPPTPLFDVLDERYDRTVVDVRRFGAELDLVHDDADAIESAVLAVHAVGGGVVHIGGPFRTSRMLQFDEVKNVTLRGVGRFVTVALPDQWEASGPDFDDRSVFYFVDCENIKVEDMSQDGSVADTAGSWLVGTRRCKGVRLTNIGAKDARAVWKDRDSVGVYVDEVQLDETEIEYSSDRVICSLIGTERFEVKNIHGDHVDEAVDMSQCADGLVENVNATAIAGTNDEVVDVGGCVRVVVRNVNGDGGFLSVVRLKEEGGVVVDDISLENISGTNWTDALLLITASGSSAEMETRIRNIRVDGLTGNSTAAGANLVRTTDVDGAVDDMEIRNASGTVAGRGLDLRRFRRLKVDKWNSVSTDGDGMRLRIGEVCELGEVNVLASGDAYEVISVSGLVTTDNTKGKSSGPGSQNVWNSLNCQGLRLHGFQALGCPHDAIRIRYNALQATQAGLTHDFSVTGARVVDWSNANSNRRAISVEVSGVPAEGVSHGGRIVGNDLILDEVSYANQAMVVFLANGGDGYASARIQDNTVLGAPEIAGSGTLGRLIDESIVAGNIVIPTPAP